MPNSFSIRAVTVCQSAVGSAPCAGATSTRAAPTRSAAAPFVWADAAGDGAVTSSSVANTAVHVCVLYRILPPVTEIREAPLIACRGEPVLGLYLHIAHHKVISPQGGRIGTLGGGGSAAGTPTAGGVGS